MTLKALELTTLFSASIKLFRWGGFIEGTKANYQHFVGLRAGWSIMMPRLRLYSCADMLKGGFSQKSGDDLWAIKYNKIKTMIQGITTR